MTMHRRHFLDLALASLAVAPFSIGAASTSVARADCAPPEERAGWLATNVHPGGDAFFWLGQPRGVPVPADLEVTIGGAASRIPIVWIVPGVARIRIPGTASGTIHVATPSRGRGAGQTFDITLTSGPPPARLSAPPTSCRLEQTTRRIRWGEGHATTIHFAAAPSTAKHVLARWASFGAAATIAGGATSASLYVDGGCGSHPLDVSPPTPGTRVEVAFLDDEGNPSTFTTVVMPR